LTPHYIFLLIHHRPGSSAPPFVRNVFTLDTCTSILGADVIPCAEESALLQGWSDFVQKVDPDLIIGFNNTGFDLPYLLARAKALQLPRFPLLSRLKGSQVSPHALSLTRMNVNQEWKPSRRAP
jgi:DNA polymerase elongation subunit (family B)